MRVDSAGRQAGGVGFQVVADQGFAGTFDLTAAAAAAFAETFRVVQVIRVRRKIGPQLVEGLLSDRKVPISIVFVVEPISNDSQELTCSSHDSAAVEGKHEVRLARRLVARDMKHIDFTSGVSHGACLLIVPEAWAKREPLLTCVTKSVGRLPKSSYSAERTRVCARTLVQWPCYP